MLELGQSCQAFPIVAGRVHKDPAIGGFVQPRQGIVATSLRAFDVANSCGEVVLQNMGVTILEREAMLDAIIAVALWIDTSEANRPAKYQLDGLGTICQSPYQDILWQRWGEFWEWVVDPDADTLTLYRIDGVTPLIVFDLTPATTTGPGHIARTPQ